MVINFFWCVILVDNTAIEHSNFITHAHCFCLIMGNKHCRNPQSRYQFLQFVAHLLSQKCVQCRKRFIKQNTAGLNHNRTSKSNPLLLSTGKLVGITSGKILQLHRLQRILYPLL